MGFRSGAAGVVCVLVAGCSGGGGNGPIPPSTAVIKACFPAAADGTVTYAQVQVVNPTDHDLVLERLTLVQPRDVELIGTGEAGRVVQGADGIWLSPGTVPGYPPPFPWPDGSSLLWAERQAIPGAVIGPTPNGDQWLAVIGMRAGRNGAGAEDLELTYRDGRRSYTFRSRTSFRFAVPPGQC